jgi:hypothetical protein
MINVLLSLTVNLNLNAFKIYRTLVFPMFLSQSKNRYLRDNERFSPISGPENKPLPYLMDGKAFFRSQVVDFWIPKHFGENSSPTQKSSPHSSLRILSRRKGGGGSSRGRRGQSGQSPRHTNGSASGEVHTFPPPWDPILPTGIGTWFSPKFDWNPKFPHFGTQKKSHRDSHKLIGTRRDCRGLWDLGAFYGLWDDQLRLWERISNKIHESKIRGKIKLNWKHWKSFFYFMLHKLTALFEIKYDYH